MKRMIAFYNEQQKAFAKARQKKAKLRIEDFIDSNPANISWTRALKRAASNGTEHEFHKLELRTGIYRPFTKQRLYFDKPFIESPGLSPTLFPNTNFENKLIVATGSGASKDFSALITDNITNLDAIEKGQCFPLYYYEERVKNQPSLFDATGAAEYIRRDGVSNFILAIAKNQYGRTVTKEDIFYYVYGILHSPDYRTDVRQRSQENAAPYLFGRRRSRFLEV